MEIDIETLQRKIAELEAQVASLQKTDESHPNPTEQAASQAVNTQGGTNFAGPVTAARDVIGRDLVYIITQIIHSGEDPEEAKSVIAAYLQALAADLAGLKLSEIDIAADQTRKPPLQLADVYVPLNTTLRIPKEQSLKAWLKDSRDRQQGEMDNARDSRPVSALQALAAHPRLTVLGKPGSGKSTFGASVLLALAQTWLGHAEQIKQLGEDWTCGPLLPIRVILRHFAERLSAGNAPARAGDLWGFIAHDLQACNASNGQVMQRIDYDSWGRVLLDTNPGFEPFG
jgi:HrpA-like RNA helicase